jgi:hypothetical protein
MAPIFPGCRPQDTRLHVTLDYLQMKTQNKWTGCNSDVIDMMNVIDVL